MTKDLTTGSPARVILSFSIPMIIGNIFQQLYNTVDTIIVGRFIGKDALAAVGSSFTVMVFVTSILLGLCMGAAVVFSQFFGAKRLDSLKNSMIISFVFIGIITLLLGAGSLLGVGGIIRFMNVPAALVPDTRAYLTIIFAGMGFTFLYNWSAGLLRALGNSKVPLYFLIAAAVLNTVLDLLFIIRFHMGVAGAAIATVIAQALSAVLCVGYCFLKLGFLKFTRADFRFDHAIFSQTASCALLTAAQQSIMNFGILLIQGLVNSFGAATMTAFAAAVKISQFAYMPVQDFGNAFSTYIAQNKGAGKNERIASGIRHAAWMSAGFCAVISLFVVVFTKPLLTIFIAPTETEILAIGAHYLLIEASFYPLIGFLFLFYGLYRGLGAAGMSIVLTAVSLGTRVLLAYLGAPIFGLPGIWWAIPIGWLLADLVGLFYYSKRYRSHYNIKPKNRPATRGIKTQEE